MHYAGAVRNSISCVDQLRFLSRHLTGIEKKKERDKTSRQRKQAKDKGLSLLSRENIRARASSAARAIPVTGHHPVGLQSLGRHT